MRDLLLAVAILSAWIAFYAVVVGLIFFGFLFRIENQECVKSFENFLNWQTQNCYCLNPKTNKVEPYDFTQMPAINSTYFTLYP